MNRSKTFRWSRASLELFGLSVLVLVWLSFGCGSDKKEPVDPVGSCQAGGGENDPLLACDLCECTSCFCSSAGWVCTGTECTGCDLTVIEGCSLDCENGFANDGDECPICACADPAEPCTEGSTKTAADGCNTCTCNADGEWSCTSETCAPECEPGETMPASDNCNICTCDTNGQWQCSQEICQGCNPGEVMPPPDDCCSCSNAGEWECTETPCSKSCEEGDTKEKGDGCNTCACNTNQEWVCTEQVCPEGADCPPAAENTCEKKVFWGKNLVTGSCCEYDSACSIPNGLEKFAALNDCEDAPWQGSPGNSDPSQATDEGIPSDASPEPVEDAGAND
jgi:hypothetical protein